MGARHNIPYKSIVDQFKKACDANVGIATFDTGTLDYLDANAVNKNYPYIYLRPLSSQGVVDRVKGNTFELYSMDVPKLSDESPIDVLSRCEERIYQLLSWFNQGQTDIQQIYEVTITDLSPVNEAFQDRVYGWVATIDVLTPFRWDYCDYPQIVPTPVPVPTPTPTPAPTPTPTPVVTSSFGFRITEYNANVTTASCFNGTGLEVSSSIAYALVTSSIPFPENLIGTELYFDEALTQPYSQSYANPIPTDSRYSIVSGITTGSRTHTIQIDPGYTDEIYYYPFQASPIKSETQGFAEACYTDKVNDPRFLQTYYYAAYSGSNPEVPYPKEDYVKLIVSNVSTWQPTSEEACDISVTLNPETDYILYAKMEERFKTTEFPMNLQLATLYTDAELTNKWVAPGSGYVYFALSDTPDEIYSGEMELVEPQAPFIGSCGSGQPGVYVRNCSTGECVFNRSKNRTGFDRMIGSIIYSSPGVPLTVTSPGQDTKVLFMDTINSPLQYDKWSYIYTTTKNPDNTWTVVDTTTCSGEPVKTVGSQWLIPSSSTIEECAQTSELYTNLVYYENPLEGCADTGSYAFSSSLYYFPKEGLNYPCNIEDTFLYEDLGGTVLWSGSMSGSVIPSQSQWIGIATSPTASQADYFLHMYHRDVEPSGSVYIQEIWGCDSGQRICLQ